MITHIVWVPCSRWGCPVKKPADKMLRFGDGYFCSPECKEQQVSAAKQVWLTLTKTPIPAQVGASRQ